MDTRCDPLPLHAGRRAVDCPVRLQRTAARYRAIGTRARRALCIDGENEVKGGVYSWTTCEQIAVQVLPTTTHASSTRRSGSAAACLARSSSLRTVRRARREHAPQLCATSTGSSRPMGGARRRTRWPTPSRSGRGGAVAHRHHRGLPLAVEVVEPKLKNPGSSWPRRTPAASARAAVAAFGVKVGAQLGHAWRGRAAASASTNSIRSSDGSEPSMSEDRVAPRRRRGPDAGEQRRLHCWRYATTSRPRVRVWRLRLRPLTARAPTASPRSRARPRESSCAYGEEERLQPREPIHRDVDLEARRAVLQLHDGHARCGDRLDVRPRAAAAEDHRVPSTAFEVSWATFGPAGCSM